MLSKQAFINVNLPMSYLLTIREVAEILGWSLKHAQTCLAKYKIPCIKSSNRVKLYTAASVRNLIWKRQGRKIADKTAPLLLSEMILFFKRFQAAEEAMVPTGAMFAEDAILQKKITWMMKPTLSSERSYCWQIFWRRWSWRNEVVPNFGNLNDADRIGYPADRWPVYEEASLEIGLPRVDALIFRANSPPHHVGSIHLIPNFGITLS